MDNNIKHIINAARHQVLLSDPEIAKVIKNVRGENMGDKEVYEHVNKVLNAKARNAILEQMDSNDDDFDFGEPELDFGEPELDFGSDLEGGSEEAPGKTVDTPSSENDEYNDEEEYNDEDEGSSIDSSSFAADMETAEDAIRGLKGSSVSPETTKAATLIKTAKTRFELSRVDYLDTIDALYKEAIATGTHRDTFNLLTFIKFIGCKDLTAAFAFLDIPNTDLSEVFSDVATSESAPNITVDGIFYNSTFNNDSILNWPWKILRPSVDVFKGCPFNNLDINRVAGRKILQIAGIDSKRAEEISKASAALRGVITAANSTE